MYFVSLRAKPARDLRVRIGQLLLLRYAVEGKCNAVVRFFADENILPKVLHFAVTLDRAPPGRRQMDNIGDLSLLLVRKVNVPNTIPRTIESFFALAKSDSLQQSRSEGADRCANHYSCGPDEGDENAFFHALSFRQTTNQ